MDLNAAASEELLFHFPVHSRYFAIHCSNDCSSDSSGWVGISLCESENFCSTAKG